MFGGQPSTAPQKPDFEAIQDSAEFAELRRRLRRFVFPMTALFLVWYLTYVLLSAYAHAFMATQVFGLVNVGLLLGLAQFVSTVLITLAYNRFARRRIDPQVALIRAHAGVESK
ncbi:DUF485 domain-containing protein [Kutzneria buriramensis]|nr:DUF485 domain-containing protein [Kutzneria buriramensis]